MHLEFDSLQLLVRNRASCIAAPSAAIRGCALFLYATFELSFSSYPAGSTKELAAGGHNHRWAGLRNHLTILMHVARRLNNGLYVAFVDVA